MHPKVDTFGVHFNCRDTEKEFTKSFFNSSKAKTPSKHKLSAVTINYKAKAIQQLITLLIIHCTTLKLDFLRNH